MVWALLFGSFLARASERSGLPFVVNYALTDYRAHNRNFDVVADGVGRVYVANFEGLLYSDGADWHVIHAPGVFRITRLYKDHNGRIWVGGYNLFGYLKAGANGSLTLQWIFSKDNKGFLGEVTDIREEHGQMVVETSIGGGYLEDGTMDDYVVRKASDEIQQYYRGTAINTRISLPDGSELLGTAGRGIVRLDAAGKELYALTEENGLCNNNVNSLYADSLGYVWGATDNGLFLLNVRAAYTRFRASEGLVGEVQSVLSAADGLYVGTLQGLFRAFGQSFAPVEGIRSACWQLLSGEDGTVYACTAGGLYCVEGGKARQLSDGHTLSAIALADGSYFTGEVDGFYHVNDAGHYHLNEIEKAIRLEEENDSTLWIQNIYGQIFRCVGSMKMQGSLPIVVPRNAKGETEPFNNTLFQQDGIIYVLSRIGLFRWDAGQGELVRVSDSRLWASGKQYPRLIYPDRAHRVWVTDNEGKYLRVYANGQDMGDFNTVIHPFHDLVVDAMAVSGTDVWAGGNFGLIHWNTLTKEPDYDHRASVYIRRVVIEGDSLVWGGFNVGDSLTADMPFSSLSFESGLREICVWYALDVPTTLGVVEYRYRLRGNSDWSAWTTETFARFVNPRPGHYLLEVMARDRYGRETPTVQLPIDISYPFYMRWYSIVGYVLALVLLVLGIIRLRMHRLLKEKLQLENIVTERTSQLRRQKDEIEEKSRKLETALDDLGKMQYQLIRQEKMATVGTLTKGLVDRILNPMNYVNNFSHMSIGLVKDLADNLDDEKDNLTTDGYDDSMDVLGMLDTNLRKIEEHGLNTTRILKAMEEMLKERDGAKVSMDIAAICRKNIEMAHSYYAKEIAACHIRVDAPGDEVVVIAEVDADQLSKTVMSILANSIYALKKKYERKPFQPMLRLSISAEPNDNLARINIYDNGIGIEPSVIGKVFDPFFTTKTTAEAVGVGMYLSREIILNHGGNITIDSVKDEYTEISITLPIKGGHVDQKEEDGFSH